MQVTIFDFDFLVLPSYLIRYDLYFLRRYVWWARLSRKWCFCHRRPRFHFFLIRYVLMLCWYNRLLIYLMHMTHYYHPLQAKTSVIRVISVYT